MLKLCQSGSSHCLSGRAVGNPYVRHLEFCDSRKMSLIKSSINYSDWQLPLHNLRLRPSSTPSTWEPLIWDAENGTLNFQHAKHGPCYWAMALLNWQLGGLPYCVITEGKQNFQQKINSSVYLQLSSTILLVPPHWSPGDTVSSSTYSINPLLKVHLDLFSRMIIFLKYSSSLRLLKSFCIAPRNL